MLDEYLSQSMQRASVTTNATISDNVSLYDDKPAREPLWGRPHPPQRAVLGHRTAAHARQQREPMTTVISLPRVVGNDQGGFLELATPV